MEWLDSEEERTLLPFEEAQAARPDDPEEVPTTGLEGHSSCPRLGQAASPTAELPAHRLTFDFLPEGDA